VLRIIVPVALLFGILSLAYMFIPIRNIRFKYAFPGAVFSTLLWITVTFLFQFYVNNFADYSRFYGTLGAVIGLLLWLSLTSIIMIVGASLNAYLIEVKDVKHPFLRKKKSDTQDMNRNMEEGKKGNEEETLSIPERKFEALKERFRKTMEAKEEKEDQ